MGGFLEDVTIIRLCQGASILPVNMGQYSKLLQWLLLLWCYTITVSLDIEVLTSMLSISPLVVATCSIDIRHGGSSHIFSHRPELTNLHSRCTDRVYLGGYRHHKFGQAILIPLTAEEMVLV